MAEVGDELVGDPAEEVIGFGEALQLDVGAERRSGGGLLVEHAVRPAGPRGLVGAHLGADLLRVSAHRGKAAGELADVADRHAVDARVARPERDRHLVDRVAVGLGQGDERRVEGEPGLQQIVGEQRPGDVGVDITQNEVVASRTWRRPAARRTSAPADRLAERPQRLAPGRRAAAHPA